MTERRPIERPVLDIRQRISGSPQEVFDAWLDPELVKLWFCGQGTTVSECRIDPRVGGEYRIVMSDAERDWPHVGVYHVVEPPSRLVFTWHTPSTSQEETLVTVTLTPDEDHTLLRLVHQQLPRATFEGHRKGWLELFGQLDALLAERSGL